MMLAAPIFLDMSRQGKLGCDIWLVHLTGEEFPADCLGAEHWPSGSSSERSRCAVPRGKSKDLSTTTVRGLYVSDMVVTTMTASATIADFTGQRSRLDVAGVSGPPG